MLPIRTIVHPTDFTEPSSYAFQMACALARDYGAKLVALHVYPVVSAGIVSVEGSRKKLLAQLREITPPDSTIPVGHALVEGEPVFEILKAAEAYDADLIVMGTHGRGGLSRLVMGSVAEAVTRKANCPVLTVRMPMSEIRTAPAETAQKQLVEIC
jgi:nucleotide-binding universal stress UspA family protein